MRVRRPTGCRKPQKCRFRWLARAVAPRTLWMRGSLPKVAPVRTDLLNNARCVSSRGPRFVLRRGRGLEATIPSAAGLAVGLAAATLPSFAPRPSDRFALSRMTTQQALDETPIFASASPCNARELRTGKDKPSVWQTPARSPAEPSAIAGFRLHMKPMSNRAGVKRKRAPDRWVKQAGVQQNRYRPNAARRLNRERYGFGVNGADEQRSVEVRQLISAACERRGPRRSCFACIDHPPERCGAP